MVDAAGAIYVLGGYGYGTTGDTFLHDVWASTDGGARAGLSRGVLGVWVLEGVLKGTKGYNSVLQGTKGYNKVLQGTIGDAKG